MKSVKRWTDRRENNPWPLPEEGFENTINDTNYLMVLGKIQVVFVALEDFEVHLFRYLTGTDIVTAGIIMKSIVSSRARIDLIRNLLEKCPRNVKVPPVMDDIIKKWERINKRRNLYIHGTWFTSLKTNQVFLSASDGEGLEVILSRKVELRELIDFFREMVALAKEMSDFVYN